MLMLERCQMRCACEPDSQHTRESVVMRDTDLASIAMLLMVKGLYYRSIGLKNDRYN